MLDLNNVTSSLALGEREREREREEEMNKGSLLISFTNFNDQRVCFSLFSVDIGSSDNVTGCGVDDKETPVITTDNEVLQLSQLF